jgi:hypothetical protein
VRNLLFFSQSSSERLNLMQRQNYLRLAVPLLIASIALPLAARAQSQASQSQTDSVAEAARRAREQKKAATDKPAPVITDDTIRPSAPAAPAPANPGDAAAAPQPNAAPSPQPATDASAAPDAAAAPASDTQAAGPEDAAQNEKASGELTDAKQKLAEAQKALELVQRELALEQDNVYSKTGYQSDTAGKAKLEELTAQLGDKQHAVDELKAQLAELLAKAAAETPAGQSPRQNPPQR